MTEPESAAGTGRRLGIAAAAVALVGVAAVLLVVLLQGEDHMVRYEVTSENDSITQIAWGDDSGIRVLRRDKPEAGSVDTPWSQTMKLQKTTGRLVLTVQGTEGADDTVTCRLLVDGKVRAESATSVGAHCMADLEMFLAD